MKEAAQVVDDKRETVEVIVKVAAHNGNGNGDCGGDPVVMGILCVAGAVVFPVIFAGQALYDLYKMPGWKNKLGWGTWALCSAGIGAGVGYVAGPAIGLNLASQIVAGSFFGGGASLLSYNTPKCCIRTGDNKPTARDIPQTDPESSKQPLLPVYEDSPPPYTANSY
jgi:hypothetical protein